MNILFGAAVAFRVKQLAIQGASSESGLTAPLEIEKIREYLN
jgi:hypothetical protein